LRNDKSGELPTARSTRPSLASPHRQAAGVQLKQGGGRLEFGAPTAGRRPLTGRPSSIQLGTAVAPSLLRRLWARRIVHAAERHGTDRFAIPGRAIDQEQTED
jgi:hypothetical protein